MPTSSKSRPLPRIGPHALLCEGPLLCITAEGDVTLEEMQQLIPIYESILAEHGRLLLLLNLVHVGQVGFDTRKYAMDWSKKHAGSIVTAVVGASFFMRNTVNFVNRALRAMSMNPSPLGFFETEAQARAWMRSHTRMSPSQKT